MVEKPKPGTAPSNLYINGRYILQPEIFAILEKQERGAGNEIQLTDGMLKLEKQQAFYGYHYQRPHLRLRLAGRLRRGQCRLRAVAQPTCTRTMAGVIGRLLDEMQADRERRSGELSVLAIVSTTGVSALQLQPEEDAVGRVVAVRRDCWSASHADARGQAGIAVQPPGQAGLGVQDHFVAVGAGIVAPVDAESGVAGQVGADLPFDR